MHDHEEHGGDACTEDDGGSCTTCGVALVDCETCNGRGYHREGCTEGGA